MANLIPQSVMRTALNALRWLKYNPFERSLADATRHQRDWLLRRIDACRDTQFGRDHGFREIRSIGDFRKRMPVAGYEAFAPYINAVAAGKTDALIPASDKLIQFTITTGSTGTPKLNPVTRSWLKDYQSGWEIWGLKLFTDHPAQIGNRILQMAGTWDMGRTRGGFQISMVSALLARKQSPLLRPFYAIPEVLNTVPDPVARHYTALRLCITESIGWIILMNPGSLIRLAEIGDQNRETLIRDVADGTLSTSFAVPDSVRRNLPGSRMQPDRAAAARLEDIVRRTGHLLPKDYWESPVVACWLGGTAGFQSRYIHQTFGEIPMRDMGLVSSEGRHTIPLEDGKPEGVPCVTAGYYEFIPISETSDASSVLEGHELQVGEDYRMLISNAAGYFRFDVGDVVRCNGFRGQAPLLEFRQKYERVGDLEGEKVTEHQIIEAAHRAAQREGVSLGLITAIPIRRTNEGQRYDFLVEIDDLPNMEVARGFLKSIDQELAELNFLWRARRKEGVIGSPRLNRLASQSWERYIRMEADRRGTGDYQYKHPGLVRNEDWQEHFEIVDTITLT